MLPAKHLSMKAITLTTKKNPTLSLLQVIKKRIRKEIFWLNTYWSLFEIKLGIKGKSFNSAEDLMAYLKSRR